MTLVFVMALFLAAIGTFAWNETTIKSSSVIDSKGGTVFLNFGTDDPQPDSIYYHDGIGGWILNGPSNLWSSTRFTPLDEFELRAVYIMIIYQTPNTSRWEAYCLQDSSGYPTSNVLAGPILLDDTPPSQRWIYAEFSDYVTFASGEDFHLCYGPCPAGPYPSGGGWWPYMDDAHTSDRNHLSFEFGYGELPNEWEVNTYGDYMVMAGGEYSISTDPVIELSEDSIDFDTVFLGDTAWADLIIYNVGGGDDLIIDSLTIESVSGCFGFEGFTPGVVNEVETNISVQLYFAPLEFGDYEGSLYIFNNTIINPVIVEMYGNCDETGVDNYLDKTLVTELRLISAYPNPFNPETTLSFTLPEVTDISLIIYDITGREISRLADGFHQAGIHTAIFNGNSLSSGIYFARLQAGNMSDMRKLVLMK